MRKSWILTDRHLLWMATVALVPKAIIPPGGEKALFRNIGHLDLSHHTLVHVPLSFIYKTSHLFHELAPHMPSLVRPTFALMHVNAN